MTAIGRVMSLLDIYKCKRYHGNDHRGHKNIGCVIFRNGIVESYGYNLYNTNKWHGSIHAEEAAINKLKKSNKNKKVDVLIFRINKSYEKIMTCLPCNECKRRLKFDIDKKGYNLNKIFCTYVNKDKKLNFLIFKKADLMCESEKKLQGYITGNTVDRYISPRYEAERMVRNTNLK